MSVILFSSCQPSKERIVRDFLEAEYGGQIEKVSQLLSDSFMYYGIGTQLNKEQYLSWLDSTRDYVKSLECKAYILNIQDFDSIIKTEEQLCSCVDLCLTITPFVQIMTYRFFDDKLISMTVDSTNNEEYQKSANEEWTPFAFYLYDKYGIEDWRDIAPDLSKYLSEYTSLSFSVKKQYKTFANLQGTYVSKDCLFYKKLIFKGKKTVTIIDAIFGFPFSTSYELDEDIVKVRTDRGDLLFEIKDSQTLVGEGFANGTFRKE